MHVDSDHDHIPNHSHLIKDNDGFYKRLLDVLERDNDFLVNLDTWNHEYHHHTTGGHHHHEHKAAAAAGAKAAAKA
jgi:hypothetical protein